MLCGTTTTITLKIILPKKKTACVSKKFGTFTRKSHPLVKCNRLIKCNQNWWLLNERRWEKINLFDLLFSHYFRFNFFKRKIFFTAFLPFYFATLILTMNYWTFFIFIVILIFLLSVSHSLLVPELDTHTNPEASNSLNSLIIFHVNFPFLCRFVWDKCPICIVEKIHLFTNIYKQIFFG